MHGPFWPCFCSNITTRSKTAQVGEIQRTADLRQLWPVAKKAQLVYMKDHESTCEELGIEWNDIIVLVHHWFLALQLFLRLCTCFSSYFNIFAGVCFAEENLALAFLDRTTDVNKNVVHKNILGKLTILWLSFALSSHSLWRWLGVHSFWNLKMRQNPWIL